MNALNDQLQGIITVSQQEYLPILAEGFLVDRKAQGLSENTILFYQKKLKHFLDFCDGQAVTQIGQVTPEVIRRFILHLADTHNPGGVHAIFRTIRAFFRWVEFEGVMPAGWQNPIRRVKAPRVALEPIEPVPLGSVDAMLKVCGDNLAGARDKAILLVLLDTGVRAQELCDINLEDVDLATGSILIRRGKGRKPRVVFFGRKTRRALRAYFHHRKDPHPALWVTSHSDRLSYDTLRYILKRRAEEAGLENLPSAHDFRRAFALQMLRNGSDIFALQRLMGHSDLSVLRRYLAQSDQDIQAAHMRASPVDNGL